MNMGLSAKHTSTVHLVLNLGSGYINSHFNTVFDDWFPTIAASLESLPDLDSPEWSKLFGDLTFQLRFDDDDDDDDEEMYFHSNQGLPNAFDHSHRAVSSSIAKHQPKIPLPIVLDGGEPERPAPLPIILEIVKKWPVYPPARSIFYPSKELLSSTIR